MNQKQLQEIVNTNIREYLDRSVKLIMNEPRINTNNSKPHEMKKCELCYHLKQSGFQFVCEHPLKGGGRPDILLLDTIPPIAYEIMVSEKQESIDKKRKQYGDIRIITVQA